MPEPDIERKALVETIRKSGTGAASARSRASDAPQGRQQAGTAEWLRIPQVRLLRVGAVESDVVGNPLDLAEIGHGNSSSLRPHDLAAVQELAVDSGRRRGCFRAS
jgi:hypothetical protein